MGEPLKNKEFMIPDDFKKHPDLTTSYIVKLKDVKSAVEWLKQKRCHNIMMKKDICKENLCPNCEAINEAFPDLYTANSNKARKE